MNLAFLTELTAKLNELNTELQDENKTIIKVTSTIDSFQRETEIMEDSADESHFPNVQSRPDGALDASVYILCIDKLFNEFQRRLEVLNDPCPCIEQLDIVLKPTNQRKCMKL